MKNSPAALAYKVGHGFCSNVTVVDQALISISLFPLHDTLHVSFLSKKE